MPLTLSLRHSQYLSRKLLPVTPTVSLISTSLRAVCCLSFPRIHLLHSSTHACLPIRCNRWRHALTGTPFEVQQANQCPHPCTPPLCKWVDYGVGPHKGRSASRGAFKFRGACNAVQSLSEEQKRRGVVTHSSGNHALSIALAASLASIPAYIVVPSNTPQVLPAQLALRP